MRVIFIQHKRFRQAAFRLDPKLRDQVNFSVGESVFAKTSNAAGNLTDDLCFNAKGELRKMEAEFQRVFLIETKDQIFYEIASKSLKFTNGLTSQGDDTW